MYCAKLSQPYSGGDHLKTMPFGVNSFSSGLPGGPHRMITPLDDRSAISGLWSKPASDTHIGCKMVKITLPSNMVSKKREEGLRSRMLANFP